MGIYLVVMEVIDFIKYVKIYPDLMDMNVIGILNGLTWIVSAFLLWHKKKAVVVATNIYLLLTSLALIPLFMIGAASAHTDMSKFEKVFPWVGVFLSLLCIIFVLIRKPLSRQAPE
jgi:uncharacterized membrane protein